MTTNTPNQQTGESQSPFAKVAECLYRHKSFGVHYGLVNRGGKQFRRSLKTTNRKHAEKRLVDFRGKVGRLTQTKIVSQLTFSELAGQWFDRIEGKLNRRHELYRHDRASPGG